tara:strand:- start:875 stop:1108 length:234 start_codon:yes stop_codon:yes gene_type:complete
MDENEYKTLLSVYQKKTHDLLTQVIALEARVITSNTHIESLTTQITDQENQIIKLTKGKPKKPTTKTLVHNIDSEGF